MLWIFRLGECFAMASIFVLWACRKTLNVAFLVWYLGREDGAEEWHWEVFYGMAICSCSRQAEGILGRLLIVENGRFSSLKGAFVSDTRFGCAGYIGRMGIQWNRMA